MTTGQLEKIALHVRKTVLRILAEAGSGHTGGSLSATDILVALYFHVLKIDPKHPAWEDRDYFILSAGHVCPALYAVMAKREFFPSATLMTLRKLRSPLQGHPSRIDLPGIETTTGSLGQGINVAVGIALGLKRLGKQNRVFCLMGDGEQEEGAVWEAAMAAAHYRLHNLISIVDLNGQQQNGPTKEIMNSAPLTDKYHAFGWSVIECDGNKMDQVVRAFSLIEQMDVQDRPTVILAHTTMAKGVPFWENDHKWHGVAPKKDDLPLAIASLAESYGSQ